MIDAAPDHVEPGCSITHRGQSQKHSGPTEASSMHGAHRKDTFALAPLRTLCEAGHLELPANDMQGMIDLSGTPGEQPAPWADPDKEVYWWDHAL